MERIERGMKRGGVREPYALMNSMGIKHGSKTVVNEDEAQAKMSAYGRRRAKRRKRLKADKAGDAMAESRE